MKSLFAVALVASSLIVAPVMAGPPLRINFHNASAVPVTQLFLRTAGSKDWGANQAGHGIAAGSRIQVLLADGANKCVAEMKLKTKAGVNFGGTVNFCQNHNFIYHGQS
jgi:hypothetical protein